MSRTQDAPAKGWPLLKRCLRCGLLALLSFSVFVCCSTCWFFIRERKMQDFCGQIAAGMPQETVIELAAAQEYKVFPSADEAAPLLVVDRKAMGRFVCEVSIQQGRVTAAKYVFND